MIHPFKHLSPVTWLTAWMTAACLWPSWSALADEENAASAAKPRDFAHEIAPLLKKYCGECHTGNASQGDLSLNTRETLLAGGASGPAAVPGSANTSELIARVVSSDPDIKMPPEGEPISAEDVQVLTEWVNQDLPWEPGFSFAPDSYEPPLFPRKPELPQAQNNREHPIDRIIDSYLTKSSLAAPAPLSDSAFARRASLDVVGLLPEPDSLQPFLSSNAPNKRQQFVADLLENRTGYAEHWLSFWNDLLRNDYDGTGFITGGRKQITGWLYQSLVDNKPYDQFARELIAPSEESRGFADGIRWRGTVSAGQTVEIQFAQSVGQSFLGINLKCASCHDSFIDRWKLEDAYGLAAIYADSPQEIHRCDKPIGKTATAQWMFPELGQIDANAPQAERLQQLAALMTHRENGRFSRTIVNRLWQRLMGRGIVHPLDAMESKPWNEDLLDYLAWDFAEHGYDLKHTIALIATSQAYQSQSEIVTSEPQGGEYVYRGPVAKRMTAEQFVDALWQITGTAPKTIDAAVNRAANAGAPQSRPSQTAQWVWSTAQDSQSAPAGETIAIATTISFSETPIHAFAVATCDNALTVYVNQRKVLQSENWEQPVPVDLTPYLKAGDNRILIVASNGGSGPNPAGLFFSGMAEMANGNPIPFGTNQQWQWSSAVPQEIDNGQSATFTVMPTDWQPVALVANPGVWDSRIADALEGAWLAATGQRGPMVRAALRKSDFLQRTLGRPNRDQIVSMRPDVLSTLEAIDLNNAQMLADALAAGSQKITTRFQGSPEKIVPWIYSSAFSRLPTDDERNLAKGVLGSTAESVEVEDLLWAVLMQPEFLMVR